jgi:hypothetical protein
MSLQSTLDEYKTNFRKKAPDEVLKQMHQATEALRNSGILEQVLKTGDRAPHFSLTNADGEMISSKEILSRKLMVLMFYRGGW